MDNHTHTSADQARVQVNHPMLAMIGIILGAFVGMFSETSLNIALPKLTANLHVTTATASWLVTGYMLMIGIVLPFSSFLSKWFTTRQVVIFGLSDFIVGALIAATAANFPILLVGRMIQGIATGLILPLMFTVTMQVFRPSKLGAAMGMCALVILFAPVIGPTVTGLILASLNWRWMFWLFIPFLVIALIFTIISLKNVGTITRPKADFIAIIESIVGFASLVAGSSLASNHGWTSPIVLGLLVVGVIVLAFYAYRQVHAETPILNLRVFTIPAFRTGATLVMLDFSVILSTMYLLPMYIQRGLLVPVALAGIVMLPGGIINAFVAALAGRLYDRYGAKTPTQIGLVIALIGAVILLLTNSTSSIMLVIIAHIIIMIGSPLALSPAQTHALSALSGTQAADGSTIMNTMQQIVGAIATALATSLLGLGIAAASGKPHQVAFTNGIHYGIYLTIAMIVVALLLTHNIKKSPVQNQAK